MITDHSSIESVKRYGKIEMARKQELMEGKVVEMKSGSKPGVLFKGSHSIKSRG